MPVPMYDTGVSSDDLGATLVRNYKIVVVGCDPDSSMTSARARGTPDFYCTR